jgi:hypothetical protein
VKYDGKLKGHSVDKIETTALTMKITLENKMLHRSAKILSFILLFSIVANYMLFAYVLSWDFPVMDQWVWLRNVVVPYANNQIDFWGFITYEFETLSHSHILTLLAIYINYHLFDLNFSINAVIGHGALIFSACYLYKQLFSQNPHMDNSSIQFLPIIAISCAFFSISNKTTFTVNLLGFEQLYLALAAIGALLIINAPQNKKGYALTFVVTLFMITLGDAMGVVAAVSLVGVYIFSALIERKNLGKLLVLITPFLMLVTLNILFDIDSRKHASHNISLFQFVTDNPALVVQSITNISSRVFFNLAQFRLHLAENQLPIQLSACFSLLIMVYAYTIYVSRKLYTHSYIPFFLLIFTGIAFLGVFSSRVPVFGPEYLHEGRYYRLFVMAGIGTLYILYLNLRKDTTALNKAITALSCLAVIGFHAAASFHAWSSMGSDQKYQTNINHQAIAYSNDETNQFSEQFRRCHKEYCQSSIEFLKNKKMSFFRKVDND